MDVEDEEGDDDVEERKPIPRPGSTLWASLHGRNAHEHFRRAILCENLQMAGDTSGDGVLCEPAQSKRT